MKRENRFYDVVNDVEYLYNEEEVEIIVGIRTRREKDVETVVLPTNSLSRFWRPGGSGLV